MIVKYIIGNKPQVKKEVEKIVQANKTFAAAVEIRLRLQRSFNSAKTQMIADFLNLPVTRELHCLSPETAENISGTLNGYGNLFSFIGFDQGDDPIKPILDLLLPTQIYFIKTTPHFIDFEISFPTAEEIFQVTPMPWASGRSWAKGIEQGISGLGWYIYRERGIPSSKSGTAIQTTFGRQSKKRPGLWSVRRLNSDRSINAKFNNIPYISSFINEWKTSFRNLSI